MERHISGNTYVHIGGESGNWDKGERFKGGKKENGWGDEGEIAATLAFKIMKKVY